MCLNDIFFIIILVCPNGTEYRHCSWNLSCSDITGVRRCKEQSPCTSGCFCSDGKVLQDGVCSNMGTCSGITTNVTEHEKTGLMYTKYISLYYGTYLLYCLRY